MTARKGNNAQKTNAMASKRREKQRRGIRWLVGNKRALCGVVGVFMAFVAFSCKLQGEPMQHATTRTPDPILCANILHAIAHVESKDRDIDAHEDGVSFGRYGVTQRAVAELIRVGHLMDIGIEYDLADPTVNASVAKAYLLLMFERAGGSWWNACEKYHGSLVKGANEAYAAKVWAAMDDQKGKS